ncbi:MAG: PTS fructose transporter subunit IIA [Rhodobacteraceae bacterium]|nr:PTS fructose transporter subunit IIA [Paracoccaceae bacterium]
MIGIVIVAHGGLAKEYLAAMEHVIGPQPGIAVIAIEPDHDRSAKEDEICRATDAVDNGNGVVVACRPDNRRILYGVNLPMLIKLATSRRLDVASAVRNAMEAGKKYIDMQNVGKDSKIFESSEYGSAKSENCK